MSAPIDHAAAYRRARRRQTLRLAIAIGAILGTIVAGFVVLYRLTAPVTLVGGDMIARSGQRITGRIVGRGDQLTGVVTATGAGSPNPVIMTIDLAAGTVPTRDLAIRWDTAQPAVIFRVGGAETVVGIVFGPGGGVGFQPSQPPRPRSTP